ncbi:TetR/AcrR family transcriptional regulator [Rhodoferax aquaticus]|uniref:TetR/AcrR family transcriptional regulator n=1 Tax=Rhodoferax aquaticus TaxID=2527691 RepID=A0A515EMK9_9BURK|nr:TetR/AcrR family transcriptional regulator [Rhodoferax aquaticus]QDL53888.1 TetR/AcrR family transcriptional regulator [Rhodoferax aquaticus]
MSKPTLLCEIVASVQAKRERRKEARPSELLAAALELFVEKGFAGTRAEEIAKRAGVSKGTLFLYFGSKDELFKAVVRENISGRFPEWHAKLDSFEGSTAELVQLFMRQWWSDVGATPISAICKLMMSEASNFPELASFYQQEVITPASVLVTRILERGIARKEVKPINMKYGVYTMLAPMLFLATWRHSFGTCCEPSEQLDPEEYIATISETVLFGLSR